MPGPYATMSAVIPSPGPRPAPAPAPRSTRARWPAVLGRAERVAPEGEAVGGLRRGRLDRRRASASGRSSAASAALARAGAAAPVTAIRHAAHGPIGRQRHAGGDRAQRVERRRVPDLLVGAAGPGRGGGQRDRRRSPRPRRASRATHRPTPCACPSAPATCTCASSASSAAGRSAAGSFAASAPPTVARLRTCGSPTSAAASASAAWLACSAALAATAAVVVIAPMRTPSFVVSMPASASTLRRSTSSGADSALRDGSTSNWLPPAMTRAPGVCSKQLDRLFEAARRGVVERLHRLTLAGSSRARSSRASRADRCGARRGRTARRKSR